MSQNRYDPTDRIKQVALLRAGPVKFAAYRVRDPETHEWSNLQFHMTEENTVIAVMSEEAAKLFSRLVMQTLENQLPASDETAS